MADLFIPAATAQKLQESFPKGIRHKAKLDIAIPLIGNGMPASAVFVVLREKFPEASESEINGVLNYASKINPTPSGTGTESPARTYYPRPQIQTPPEVKRTPLEHAQWWLSGATTTTEQFKTASQLQIPTNRAESLSLALEMLYDGSENINIVCAYLEDGGKAKPHGPGRILSRDKWLEYIASKGVPDSKAGAWVRPNPCADKGTGAAGSVTDSDVTAWKFLLLESDVLPIGTQLALFSRLKLPIAAVIMSGGISAHAWVKLDAKTPDQFKESARRILAALIPFGIDQANKNASRLSRLPEAKRVIGAAGDGVQSLLWLNPARPAVTAEDLKVFESSLEIPAIEEKPFKKVIIDSIARYEELVKNRGNIGTPTGFSEFDRDTGGLHPGTMSIIAAETNGGKSSVAINIVNNALKAGHGVALFTLEMGRDEIADLLFAINATVDRNHFNTGDFSEQEIQKMSSSVKLLSNMPLWVFDESVMTASHIRKNILALKAENKIKLAVVDYAQIVAAELGDNREQQVAAIARTLCATAKDAKIALLVLSQLNDEGKLRESRVIAHEAHNVFLLENNEENRQIKFRVVKGRRIQKKDYTLSYDTAYCQIRDTLNGSRISDEDVPDRRYSND
jgi:KaiC/GvpD/RAD55 family RecA-like ATPase